MVLYIFTSALTHSDKFSGHARRNCRQGYNPRTHALSCFCTTHRARLACAKNKGERVCVGGRGRVELGDDELLETFGGGNQTGLCSHWKIWPFDLERPAPA